jgi:heme oxygenase
MTIVLSERLRSETKALHTEVERSGIMPAFLRGQIERAAYCSMLRNLFEIYAALEPALDRCVDEPAIAAITRPELARVPALIADLQHLHGANWRTDLSASSAAIEYGQRLLELAVAQPQLLIAHAYVRYLGDLSGGQILKRIVVEALQLRDGQGTRFYEFPEAPGAAALARDFRVALDATAMETSDIDAIVAEAKRGFRLHTQLFHELAAALSTTQART